MPAYHLKELPENNQFGRLDVNALYKTISYILPTCLPNLDNPAPND